MADAGFAFEVVAHRGLTDHAPENTLAAFESAIELGADAVELDVRLTRDGVPAVFHYFYLDEVTAARGTIYQYTYPELAEVDVYGRHTGLKGYRISTLPDVLDAIGGRTGLEIELKGPETEAVDVVARVLQAYKHLWDTIEVTSYELLLLRDLQQRCPSLATDLLHPRSEAWMKQDVSAYLALHRARQARARAVHMHPTQLTAEIVTMIRAADIDVHMWDANTEAALQSAVDLRIQRVCTDKPAEALAFRSTCYQKS